jgi:transaldolase
MKATQMLHNLGQSIWLDNITRDLLDSGTLKRYIDDLSVTGLTSNPTIFDHAITHSKSYDSEIRRLVGKSLSGEALFFELAVQDLTRAADLFAPIHERTAGVDGWVSLEVSPLLAYDAKATVAEATALHKKANRRNLFIKIPGTKEGAPAIEDTIFSGVPVNVVPESDGDKLGIAIGQQTYAAYCDELESKPEPNLEHDTSTNSLIRRYRGLKETSR